VSLAGQYEVDGLSDLERKLSLLSKNTQKKVLRAAVRKGAKPVMEEAKGKVPIGLKSHRTYKGQIVQPGFSASKVLLRTSARKRDDYSASAMIGMEREAFYAINFVELGVASRGIAPRPWLRPTFNARHEAMIAAIAREIDIGIDKAIANQIMQAETTGE